MGGPIHGDLLDRVMRSLKERGFIVEEARRDRGGVYCYIMMTPEDRFPFALVAKGSALMGEITSVQKELVDTWQSAILMAWLPPDSELLFYLFNPHELLHSRIHIKPYANIKKEPAPAEMWNFSMKHGRRWHPLKEKLSRVWKGVKGEKIDAYF